jgi:hypothetical protein
MGFAFATPHEPALCGTMLRAPAGDPPLAAARFGNCNSIRAGFGGGGTSLDV